MTEFLSQQFAATLAGEIFSRLSPGYTFGKDVIGKGTLRREVWRVSGSLPLKAHEENGRTHACVTVSVGLGWLFAPPVVTVHESFIRRGEADWHTYTDGSLCYVLKAEWVDRLAKLLATSDEDIAFVIDQAATWLLAAVDSLTTRHLHAARHNIQKWPSDWAAYAHGEAGVKQYLRDKAKQGKNQK